MSKQLKGDLPKVFKPVPNIILRKNNMSILKSNNLKSVKPLFKEDIIYQSRFGDFLRVSDSERITLVNRLNLATMRSYTVATYTRSGKVVCEKTSEYIASVIGQDNYDIVFSSLCSVISQEFKIRAILALLTVPKKPTEKQSQSSQSDLSGQKIMVENWVQTVESCIDVIKKPSVKRMKRQLSPYVVTETDVPEKLSKVVIYPENFESFSNSETVTVKSENIDSTLGDSQISFLNSEHDSEHLSMLKCDEDSRDSIGNLSSLSIITTPELMKAPLSIVDQFTKPVQCVSSLTMLDGTVVDIPCKIEDDFHVATPEILKSVSPEYRRKLLWYQAYTDWKYCLTRDDDDNLPIHLAVLNDDVHLLRRQCLVLKTRKESIDITTGDNMTALQMSILASSPACTALLIQLGANPLVMDEEYRTCFHLAAEAGAPHLDALVKKCEEDPLSILRNSDELWKPEVAIKPKDYQVKYLLHKVCTMFDSQGYTPLMLASKLGKHDAVQTLVKASPSSVDYRATSSGATALYLAVGAACTDSAQRGNKSKVFDEFKKTIEHLVEAGADPNIDNYSGSDVNTLLADLNNSELSMVLASKRTVVNCKDLDTNDSKPFMLIKENDGTLMNIKDQMKKTKEINRIKEEIIKEVAVKGKKTKKEKPIIVENKVIAKPSKGFINTYKTFVDKMNNPVFSKQDKNCKIRIINDGEKPSTSKLATENALKLALTKAVTTKPLKLSENDNATVNSIVSLNKNDTGKANEDKIKTEISDSLTTNVNSENSAIVQNQNSPLPKADKRRIIVHADVSLPPLNRLAPKPIKDQPSSPKRKKTEDNSKIDKT